LNIPAHHSLITHDFTDLDNKNAPLPDSVCPYPAPDNIVKIKVQEIKNPDKPKGKHFAGLLGTRILFWDSTKHTSFVCFSDANFCMVTDPVCHKKHLAVRNQTSNPQRAKRLHTSAEDCSRHVKYAVPQSILTLFLPSLPH
jgi:hypothetical protein